MGFSSVRVGVAGVAIVMFALGAFNACDVHLQTAQKLGLVPSKAKPEVVEVTQLGVDEVSLRLRGTYADGRIYETEFRVFRSGEQLQAGNVVYWLPVGRLQVDCKYEPGHVECGTTAGPPSQ